MVNVLRVVFVLFFPLFISTSVFASELAEALNATVYTHPRILQAKHDSMAAAEKADAVFRDSWTPQLEMSASAGVQDYKTGGSESKGTTPTEARVRATQLITDFGQSSSNILGEEFTHKQKESVLDTVRQSIIFEGLKAYVQVQRYRQVVDYSVQSEENIKRQTKLETIRVEEGRGYSSNVLQAKTQLAGARARLNQARTDFDVAIVRFDNIFREAGRSVKFDEHLNVPEFMIPATLEEALEIAFKNNPRIATGAYRTRVLKEAVDFQRSKGFFPRLNLVGELQNNHDKDGHDGEGHDNKAMVEIRLPFNTGLSALSYTESARQDYLASRKNEIAVRDEIERNLRIAWRNLETARENSVLLKSKVDIAAEFLRLAQEERLHGRRSLLDVLTAETTLINSQSEYAETEAEILQSSFALLNAMGRLDMDVVRQNITAQR